MTTAMNCTASTYSDQVAPSLSLGQVQPAQQSYRQVFFAAATIFSTLLLQGIQPVSLVYPTDTAKTYVHSSDKDQRLDSERADLKIIARIRELGTYPEGWDGAGGKAPTYKAVRNAEKFVRSLPLDRIHSPYISLAADGEITFLWALPDFRLDLGFYGDGTYSYYGRTKDGKEFLEDERAISEPLPEEIVGLIEKNS